VQLSLARRYLELIKRGAKYLSYTLVLDDNWPSRRTAEKLGAFVCANYMRNDRTVVATHNSVYGENFGVLRRTPYRGRHAYDPVGNGFSDLLPVSASGLSGTGGSGSATSGGRSPSAAARPSVA
jgi:hypothetical protein